jgi:hypothetical protein
MNPFIRYLNRTITIGGRMEINANGGNLMLFRGGKMQEYLLPDAVRDFLERFHKGSIRIWKKAEAEAGGRTQSREKGCSLW